MRTDRHDEDVLLARLTSVLVFAKQTADVMKSVS